MKAFVLTLGLFCLALASTTQAHDLTPERLHGAWRITAHQCAGRDVPAAGSNVGLIWGFSGPLLQDEAEKNSCWWDDLTYRCRLFSTGRNQTERERWGYVINSYFPEVEFYYDGYVSHSYQVEIGNGGNSLTFSARLTENTSNCRADQTLTYEAVRIN